MHILSIHNLFHLFINYIDMLYIAVSASENNYVLTAILNTSKQCRYVNNSNKLFCPPRYQTTTVPYIPCVLMV